MSKIISISNWQLTRDIIALEPLEVKSVLIGRDTWTGIRPFIKILQELGMWYDVSECGNKIMLRCKMNQFTQAYIEKML